jgi:hypothetical protein
MNIADELAAMLAEVAALDAEVAALMPVAGIFYHAGWDDAPHGTRAPAHKPPRRDRGKLKLVP